MNSTERFKIRIGVYRRRHDHLTDNNQYWRNYRDICVSPTGDPKLRLTPHPGHEAGIGVWARRSVATGHPMHPIKTVRRFFILSRMLGTARRPRWWQRIDARHVAYGNRWPLQRLREQARELSPLTPRQQRIRQLIARKRP